jgi:hypothetical protein
MLRILRRAGVVASLLALAAVTALGGAAAATPGNEGGGGGLQVVADGLDNPRGIGFGPDGALYVAESGSGGPNVEGNCITSPESGAPSCFGRTGAVTRIAKGSQHRVLTGLPSVAEVATEPGAPSGVAATGPVDLGFDRWTGYLLIGNPGGGTGTREQFDSPAARRFGKLLKVDLRGIRAVADFPRFEERNNPDGGGGLPPDLPPEAAIDSNPNGLLVRKGGTQLVADAGGNDLLKVDRKGRISVVAVFPFQAGVANPFPPPPAVDSQSVPTSVVKGPDSAYYVGELTGFPFPVGGARVWRVVPGKDPKVFARGFTNIIDIAFDKRGRLYVLEIATGGLANTPPDQLPVGRLVRVNKDGSRTTLASEGLNAPGGFVLGHDAAYITNNSILSDAGQVVKVKL